MCSCEDPEQDNLGLSNIKEKEKNTDKRLMLLQSHYLASLATYITFDESFEVL